MEGAECVSLEDHSLSELSGILPRTAEFLFSEIDRLRKNNMRYIFTVSCFEIYCDEVHDLLCPDGKSGDLKLITKKNGVEVSGLTQQSALTKDHLWSALQLAHQNKTFEKTVHNDRSSRAHTVFQIEIAS